MPEVLAYGKISGRQNAAGGDRIFLSYDNHTAVLSLYRFGNRETWPVAGWLDDKPSGAQAKVYDSADATSAGATRFPSGDGAEGETILQSLGADDKPLFHDRRDRAPRSHALSESAVARGFVTMARGQEYPIQLLKTANLSTILHETGHGALLERSRLVSVGTAERPWRKPARLSGISYGADGKPVPSTGTSRKPGRNWALSTGAACSLKRARLLPLTNWPMS